MPLPELGLEWQSGWGGVVLRLGELLSWQLMVEQVSGELCFVELSSPGQFPLCMTWGSCGG